MGSALTNLFSQASSRLADLVREGIRAGCAGLAPRRIVIKPNWVLHETDPCFPIRALVTDPRLVETVTQTCLDLWPDAESIRVCDCPLQWADWPLMLRQSATDKARDRLERISGGRVRFLDLRREVFSMNRDGFLEPVSAVSGDPAGYREVNLDTHSHLEPLSHEAHRFAVNDYRSSVTSSHHGPGHHRYLVSQSVLDADLFINLPKWKTHQKSAITAALKNLVGINGDKAYLPHFRRGAPKWGGDEYADDHRWLYWTQTTLREATQKTSPRLFKLLRPGWRVLKRLRGIETRFSEIDTAPRNFYVAGGAWHGNDTIWRMIYDLNLILQCVDAKGVWHDTPQRRYLTIVDGLVSGEGNGPLQPLPRETDWLALGNDPFAIDTALAFFMGFDPARIPLLAQRDRYLGPEWGRFDLENLEIGMDSAITRLVKTPVNFGFAPPPGWRAHVER